MARDKTTSPIDTTVGENNSSSEPLIDIDSFLTAEGISPVWINGLRVYLASQQRLGSKTLQDWREVFQKYQKLS